MSAAAAQASHSRFEAVFDRISHALQDRYGLRVEVVECDAFTDSATEFANLQDGLVRLSPARSREQQGYILAHVFGHLVQHRDAAKYRNLIELIESPPPIALRPSEEREYLAFEMEASAWGEALMRACMPVTAELLQRFKAFVLTDFAHYLSYLTTGVQTDTVSFQKAFADRTATPIGTIWNSAGLVLPGTLILEDVNISVL